MTDAPVQPSASTHQGTYALGYSAETHRWMSERTAATHAAFLLPHLVPGMRLLDCGCGPGSITLGLAEAVTPAEVVGIDVAPIQIERAQELATAQRVTNIRFEVASITALPFEDASFDAVFAHAVLYHLPDPHLALRECRRVLKPGGCIGIRDTDYSVWLLEPTTPALAAFQALSLKVAARNGASPTYARQQQSVLIDSGFVQADGYAQCVRSGTSEAVQHVAKAHLARLQSDDFRSVVLQQRWATEADLAMMEQELNTWAQRPDAFQAVMWRATVGFVSTRNG